MKQYLFFLCIFGASLFTPALFLNDVAAGEYIVGSGDVLEINVYENEDLSARVRVSADDTIRVPLLGEMIVSDMTVSQIAQKIENQLADGFLVHPQVDVFIEEYRSKRAIILGQVSKPGLYELRGTVSFLELLSKAGGTTSETGPTAVVKRKNPSVSGDDRIVIDLIQLIRQGDASLNIPIQDGDNIYVTRADTIYVTGEVTKPDAYSLEPGMTVIMAVTKAEGFTSIARKNRIRIIRNIDGENTTLQNVSMDEEVKAGDVIVVPERFF